jgi:two-component sensor histidine kinase
MPLGILSVVQSQEAQREVDISTLEGVAGASLRAVQPQIDVIRDAQITARVLAQALSISFDEGGECTRRVKAVARGFSEASLIAYIPLSGVMTCSSNDQVHDFSGNPLFQRMTARALPTVIYNPMGPITRTAVVGIGHPVFDSRGAQIGIVTISLPYLSVAPQDYADPLALWRPSYLATLSSDGTLLISSDPDLALEDALPEGITTQSLPDRTARPIYVEGTDGLHILSVTQVADDLFLLAVWQRQNTLITRLGSATPYAIPVLTWIAALLAASLASGQFVVRHVRSLSRSMSDYVTHRTRAVVPDITNAPREIQRLHAVYEQLILTIERDEAELQNLLVDKDVLLREVNHRSGNSLQVITSVMRMYRRETTDPTLRQVLDGLINRVIALSSTHTSLYSLSGRRDVPVDEVLDGVVRRLKEIHGIALGVARKQLQPTRMAAEAAVPLALALAEIISSLFLAKTVSEEGVDIRLDHVGDRVHLTVSGPDIPEFRTAHTGFSALPRRMLLQFATQLRGQVSMEAEGGRLTIMLDVPHR